MAVQFPGDPPRPPVDRDHAERLRKAALSRAIGNDITLSGSHTVREISPVESLFEQIEKRRQNRVQINWSDENAGVLDDRRSALHDG